MRHWMVCGLFVALLAVPAAPLAAQEFPANPQNNDELPEPAANLIRRLTRALAEQDDTATQAIFAPDMPQYRRILGDILNRIAVEETNCTVEVVRQEGDDEHWTAQLDWLMQGGTDPQKRAVITVNFGKVDGEWRITGFNPADWFALPAQ